MTTINLGEDINATIVAAVNARITAETFAALSNDETLGKFVQAALYQPVKDGGPYSSKTKPFIESLLASAVQAATKAAVSQWVQDNQGPIKERVTSALTNNLDGIADAMVQSMINSSAAASYNTKVDLTFEKRRFED
jgi:hypothetical protein